MPGVDFVKTFINDNIFYFVETLTIFQACLEKNFYVPRFCYHSKLSIAGNCRMCLLEEKKTNKPVVSCAMNLVNGMQVYTRTRLVKSIREAVVEFLLINHPLDCPICDQGGECDLQDETMVFGADRGRFYESKRAVKGKNFGPFIKLFLNRCIHCARCTRFFDEYIEAKSLSLLGRGKQTEIGLYLDRFLLSEVSGNIIDLCPVGAITSKPASYVGRDWEYFSLNTVDIFDSINAALRIDFRGNSVLRVLPRSSQYVNEDWITDKARFFYDAIYLQRLSRPFYFQKLRGLIVEVTWLQIFFFMKKYFFNIISYYTQRKKKYLFNQFCLSDIEDISNFMSIDYFISFYNTFFIQNNNFCSTTKLTDTRSNFFLTQVGWWEEMEIAKYLCLICINLRFEAPIFFLRLKRILRRGKVRIYCFGYLSNMLVGSKIGFFGNSFNSVKNALIKSFGNVEDFLYLIGGASGSMSNLFNMGKYCTTNKRFLFKSTSNINSAEISFISKNVYRKKYFNNKILFDCHFLYNFNFDNFIHWTHNEKYMGKLLLVYQGTHADYSVKFYNIILPTLLYIERKTLFVNNFAYIQEPEYINFKYRYNLVREDKDILLSLLELFSFRKGGEEDNKGKLEQFILKSIFYLYNLSNISFSSLDFNYKNNNYFYLVYYFSSLINDYYRDNSILRNSVILLAGAKMSLVINDFKFCCKNF